MLAMVYTAVVWQRPVQALAKRQSTDPVWVWVLGDGWFLTQRCGYAGKCEARRTQWERAQIGRYFKRCWQQCHRVASLTGLASSAMILICRHIGHGGLSDCLMAIRFNLILMVKSGCSPYFMGASRS